MYRNLFVNITVGIVININNTILVDSRVTFRNGMESLQKSQLTRSLEAENRRQAQTLFGVVALFAVSHVFRVVLNIHEIFVDALFTRASLGPGCVSPVPFWTHVSLI